MCDENVLDVFRLFAICGAEYAYLNHRRGVAHKVRAVERRVIRKRVQNCGERDLVAILRGRAGGDAA